jgi:hypothetical protein
MSERASKATSPCTNVKGGDRILRSETLAGRISSSGDVPTHDRTRCTRCHVRTHGCPGCVQARRGGRREVVRVVSRPAQFQGALERRVKVVRIEDWIRQRRVHRPKRACGTELQGGVAENALSGQCSVVVSRDDAVAVCARRWVRFAAYVIGSGDTVDGKGR